MQFRTRVRGRGSECVIAPSQGYESVWFFSGELPAARAELQRGEACEPSDRGGGGGVGRGRRGCGGGVLGDAVAQGRRRGRRPPRRGRRGQEQQPPPQMLPLVVCAAAFPARGPPRGLPPALLPCQQEHGQTHQGMLPPITLFYRYVHSADTDRKNGTTVE